ncbi:hypothetical protein K440DRAFT_679508 [Wilcoxina mikolae CBS 423.85]|nr:hypothetical protein K440DRAFT_679508 [Wilcoxina mikolae CBS 423.85]
MALFSYNFISDISEAEHYPSWYAYMSLESNKLQLGIKALSPVVSATDLDRATATVNEMSSNICELVSSLELAGAELVRSRFPGRPPITQPHTPPFEAFHKERQYLERRGCLNSSHDSVRRYLAAQASLIDQVQAADRVLARDCFALYELRMEIGFIGLCLPRCIASPNISQKSREAFERWRQGHNGRGSMELKELIHEAKTWEKTVWRMVKAAKDEFIDKLEDSEERGGIRKRG